MIVYTTLLPKRLASPSLSATNVGATGFFNLEVMAKNVSKMEGLKEF
jgi:hypothetical protein